MSLGAQVVLHVLLFISFLGCRIQSAQCSLPVLSYEASCAGVEVRWRVDSSADVDSFELRLDGAKLDSVSSTRFNHFVLLGCGRTATIQVVAVQRWGRRCPSLPLIVQSRLCRFCESSLPGLRLARQLNDEEMADLVAGLIRRTIIPHLNVVAASPTSDRAQRLRPLARELFDATDKFLKAVPADARARRRVKRAAPRKR